MPLPLLLLLLMTTAVNASPPSAQGFGVTQSEWLGYTRYDFVVAGQPALLIVPKAVAPGRPWVWRAEWFGERHGPQVALALLERGWHYAYINASDRYGGPEAMRIFDAFYQHLTTGAGLAPRVVLEGFSRGGLYAFNFAATWPERVAALYLDAPALDLRSWPGRHDPRWGEVAAHYGLTADELKTAGVNPLDRIAPVAAAGIPIIGVSGDADPIVRYEENLAVLAERYRAAGGRIEIILKPGAGHSPHGLPDPTPIVEFLLEHAKR